MLSSEEGENEVFFDSLDSLSVEESVLAKAGSESGNLEYEIWMDEPQSVEERRERFLRGMDLVEFTKSSRMKDLDRLTERSDAVPSSSFSSVGNVEGSIAGCHREVTCEANLLIDEQEQEQIVACEGQNKVLETQENFDESENAQVNRKKFKKWWKHFLSMRKGESRRSSMGSEPSFEVHKTNRIMAQSNKKGYMEFSELYTGQEIQAHKGFIWTMKFSPDGQYLASGGEDGVVRMWRVTLTSIDAFSKPLIAERGLGRSLGKGKFGFGREKLVPSQVVIPDKIFWIEESPIHEFHGHASDVLDLAWSNSNFLASSSMDKTVRLWQVGCDQCLNIFHHNNYVTCIQFNPIDDNYFISGSIDGKVRIWGVSEKRVVRWVDARDMITAICYRPDGKEFIVGSIRGTCHFYEVSGNGINLEAEVQIRGRKKASGNKITSIQFSQDEPHKVMITSKDSKIRILDGINVVSKFKGLPKSRSQMSASFTSTGRHIISVGEDSRVYVWNNDKYPRTSKHTKSVTSCEHFFCEDMSVAIPWLGQGSDHRHSVCYPRKYQKEGVSQIRDSQRFSLGSWFSNDGSFKGSATWPEEKLPLRDTAFAEDEFYIYENQQLGHDNGDYHAVLPETWGLVIVAGSQNGMIRTIQNYGLPVTL